MLNRRQAVIDSAMKLFSEKGYLITTVDEIAREAGVSKGSFYKMFESKDELFKLNLNQISDALFEIVAHVHRLPNVTPLEKIEKFGAFFLQFVFQHKKFVINVCQEKFPFSFDLMVLEFEQKIMNFAKDMLVSSYGHQIDDYIWDIATVLFGILKEYLLNMLNINQSDIPAAAKIISGLMDASVQFFLNTRPTPVITTPEMRKRLETVQNSPLDKGDQVNALFQEIESKIDYMKVSKDLQKELYDALECLKEEMESDNPRTVLLKSLLGYLECYNQLSELCHRFRLLLFTSVI
jgi:AcrR family transcriptional regulator